MNEDFSHLTGLEADIASRITPSLESMGYEIVRIAVLGKETPTIQIMADRLDGSLITIEDCEQISHAVGAILDVEDPLPNAWTLEVSSAGIDRPLVRIKDWNRFSGHEAKVELSMPLNGRKRFAGIVLGADEDFARIRLENGEEIAFPFLEIRKARLVLTDALIEASAHLAGADQDQRSKIPKLNPAKPGKNPARKTH